MWVLLRTRSSGSVPLSLRQITRASTFLMGTTAVNMLLPFFLPLVLHAGYRWLLDCYFGCSRTRSQFRNWWARASGPFVPLSSVHLSRVHRPASSFSSRTSLLSRRLTLPISAHLPSCHPLSLLSPHIYTVPSPAARLRTEYARQRWVANALRASCTMLISHVSSLGPEIY
jgi:hypothetical protein